MFLSLFAFGAVGFWVALIVLWVIMTVVVELEKGWGATLTMGAAVGLVLVAGKSDVLNFVASHWIWFVAAIPVYLAAGTGWGIGKWKWLVMKAKMKYDELREEFEHGAFGNAEELEKKAHWTDIIYRARLCGTSSNCHCGPRPLARQHKALVMMWMCCWPWSLVWTMLKDPVREAFRYIYYRTAALLQRISDKAFAGTSVHLMTPEEKTAYETKQHARNNR